jgi:hypothetical protein
MEKCQREERDFGFFTQEGREWFAQRRRGAERGNEIYQAAIRRRLGWVLKEDSFCKTRYRKNKYGTQEDRNGGGKEEF